MCPTGPRTEGPRGSRERHANATGPAGTCMHRAGWDSGAGSPQASSHLVDVGGLREDRDTGAATLPLASATVARALPGLIAHATARSRPRDLVRSAVLPPHAQRCPHRRASCLTRARQGAGPARNAADRHVAEAEGRRARDNQRKRHERERPAADGRRLAPCNHPACFLATCFELRGLGRRTKSQARTEGRTVRAVGRPILTMLQNDTDRAIFENKPIKVRIPEVVG